MSVGNNFQSKKEVRLKATFPDMDGKTVYVRSEQEQKICFALSSLSVKFRYEEPYEHPLVDEMHSQYKPDFSIYFEQGGETKRIYLEHFEWTSMGLFLYGLPKTEALPMKKQTKSTTMA